MSKDKTLSGLTRREFLKAGAAGALAAGLGSARVPLVFADQAPKSKERKAKLNSGIPLGGLGAGTVEIRDDGLFHQWELFGNWRSDQLDLSFREAFFALQTRTADGFTGARVLATERRGALEPVDSIQYTGQFPFARLDYAWEDAPCKVRLNAFSTFIPHDSANSGVPAAIFEFEITNTAKQKCRASVAGCFQNMVGNDQSSARLKNQVTSGKKWHGVVMSAEELPDGASSNGTMVLASLDPEASADAGGSVNDILIPFADRGTLRDKREASGPAGAPLIAAVSSGVDLDPLETKTVTLLLTWYFPHFISAEKIDIGRMYSNRFDSASSVADYVTGDFSSLVGRTRHFRDVFYGGNLPYWFIDSVNAQFTTAYKSSWWTKDGTFAIWEGLGCCGMQTLDVAYYGSVSIIMLFPDLAKQAMRLSARFQNPAGRMPHFFPGTFQEVDSHYMIDLMAKFTLQLYRDYIWTGDRQYLDEMWPHAHAAMEASRALDRNGDFVIDDHGIDQSYDGWEMEGASAYVGLINTVGYRAAARMAAVYGQTDLASQYNQLATLGAASLNRLLWNGEYFDLYYDIATDDRNTGCMADQVNGAWFADMVDLNGFLPAERVNSALDSIYKYNRGSDHIRNGTWRHGGPTGGGQWSAVWSGTEGMLASHMIYQGRVDEGLWVAKAVYDRYAKDGRTWNQSECGDHYYRAMVVMALLLAAQGFHYNAVEGSLGIDPRLQREDHVSPFLTPLCWGQLSFAEKASGTDMQLKLMEGKIELSTVAVGSRHSGTVKVTVDGKAVASSVAAKDGVAHVSLASPVALSAGSTLAIELS